MAVVRRICAGLLLTLGLVCLPAAAPAAEQKKTQKVSFTSTPPNPAAVGGSYIVTATGGGSKNPVTLSVPSASSSVCNLSGSVSGATAKFTGPGTCTIDADQAGNTEYEPAPQAQQSFTVTAAKKSQTVTIESKPPEPARAGESYAVKASASSKLPVTIGSSPAAVCKASGSTVELKGAGKCTVTASQAGSTEYEPAKAEQTFTVSRKSQAVAFKSEAPSPGTVRSTYTVEAEAESKLPVAYSTATPTICEVSGPTVTFLAEGKCTVEAEQRGSTEYEPAKNAQQVNVVKKAQKVAFKSTPPNPATVRSTYTAEAEAESKLPVTYSTATPTICEVSGSTVTFLAEGKCTVEAAQAGSTEYEPAKASQPITVVKKAQTVTFKSTPPNPATVKSTYTAEAEASSKLGVAYFTATPTICEVSGSTVTFLAEGNCNVEAEQAGNGEYAPIKQAQTIAVVRKAQAITITSTPPEPASVGGIYSVKATASSGLAVSVKTTAPSVCSISESGVVRFIAVGECTVIVQQAGDSSYAPALEQRQSFGVGKRIQAITFTSSLPSSAQTGGPSYSPTATASSGLPVTFAIDPASSSVCTISGTTVTFIGTGICTIDADQAGNAEYLPAPQVRQSFPVATVQVLSTKTSTGPAMTALAPEGGFKAVSAMLHTPSDVITLNESLAEPGTLTWVVTFPNGPYGAYAAGKKCRSGRVRLGGRCLPQKVIFGAGQQTFTSAGVVSITIKPSRAAKRAFQVAKRRHKDIKLTAAITFQPLHGGAPVQHTQVLTIRLAKAK